jgi:hypothetical protein
MMPKHSVEHNVDLSPYTIDISGPEAHAPERTLGHNVVRLSHAYTESMFAFVAIGATAEQLAATDHDDTTNHHMNELRWAKEQYGYSLALAGINYVKSISATRARINSLDATGINNMQAYMNSYAPEFLSQQLQLATEPGGVVPSWQEWLGRRATIEQLTNVLAWHNHIIGEHVTDVDIEAMTIALRTPVVQAITDLQQRGQLMPSERDMSATEVIIGDTFDTDGRQRAGYFEPNDNVMVVHQGIGTTTLARRLSLQSDVPRVVIHELVHAAIDTTYINPHPTFSVRWIQEALTEKLSRIIRSEYMDENNSVSRAYNFEIDLLDALCSKGDSDENMRLAQRAYSGGDTERDQFIAAIDAAWGYQDVIEKIHERITKYEVESIKAGKMALSIERMAAVESAHVDLNKDPDEILRPELPDAFGLAVA